MNIVIGIISYFPDNDTIRLQKLNNLLKTCDKLFKLPIIIIAQNWGKNVDLYKTQNSSILLYSFVNKLGITEARRQLRDKFINSNYDYLIMLDDDAVINGTQEEADNYINDIKSHPNGFGVHGGSLILKLFAVSKDIYSKFDLPKGDISNFDYFEDMYIIMGMSKLFSDKKFCFSEKSLRNWAEPSEWENSTWAVKDLNRHIIGDRTREMVKRLC